jgi:formylglycine-generating enzyme required for sulfatase activity
VDRCEVTNQQYADALNWALGQGGLITLSNGVVYQHGSGTSYPYCDTRPTSEYSQITWNGSVFGVVAGKGSHPMVVVSWYGSVAYANWRSGMQGLPPCYDLSTWECNWGGGYRLPTEAEWERAARGNAAGRRFPWSGTDNIDHSRANYYSSSAYFYDIGLPLGYDPLFDIGATMPYTSPVGHFAPTGYGLYDMSGNVWEWCNDRFDGSYYSSSPNNNPHGPVSGNTRVLRGGSWSSLAVNLRCAYRSDGLPNYRAIVNGFRLVSATQ